MGMGKTFAVLCESRQLSVFQKAGEAPLLASRSFRVPLDHSSVQSHRLSCLEGPCQHRPHLQPRPRGVDIQTRWTGIPPPQSLAPQLPQRFSFPQRPK